MLPREVNTFIYEKLKNHLFVWLITIMMLLFFYIVYSHSITVLSSLQSNSNVILAEYSNLSANLVRFTEDVNIWNSKLHTVYQDRRGLRLDTVQKIIEDQRNINNIRSVSVNLTAPDTRDNFEVNKDINLEYSIVSITFTAYTDIDAARFAASLAEKIPGIYRTSNFTLTGIPSVTSNIVDDSNKSAPKLRNIVDGKLEFIWHDFQDIKREARL